MPYGETWRIHRKLFHKFFNPAVSDQYDDKILHVVNVFLRRLSESPERFLKHAHLYVRSSLFALTLSLSQAHCILFRFFGEALRGR